ncbi:MULTISPECIES: methyltransferase domain-containing protein [Bacteria]|uniref:class I SAM-dependent methyltransferase n=1 Tax=Bacteria TaxID=2 RepID=UPI001040C711|nr:MULTISPECIES: methyltransferase domain-containing protein [Bacteria]QDM40000.1 methyltransferase domain-containing protein [Altererythrobacter sp. TH136]TCJ37455.1 methyltransferase domain-containing protein [Parafrankia sp. BMG5.11]
MRTEALLALALFAVTGCDQADPAVERPETALAFPQAERAVSDLGSNQFSTEDQRDSVGEARKVMDLAEIRPGMTVADIGAGEGYYTIRLAETVGGTGRVLAQDIDRAALDRLAQRVERERLDNVSIRLGTADDPKLPANSFDRVFMVHMYHEVQEPYAFLWRLWPSLKQDGRIVVVDIDRPTNQHGIDPLLLSCEFERVGFQLETFKDSPELAGYYAQFKRAAKRPEPQDIRPCKQEPGTTGGAAR